MNNKNSGNCCHISNEACTKTRNKPLWNIGSGISIGKLGSGVGAGAGAVIFQKKVGSSS